MKMSYCASKGVIIKDGKFLVIKQRLNDKELYDLPGGRIERGRTPEEHLKIEIKEEVGLDVEVGKLIGYSYFIREVDGDQVICLLFECKPLTYNIDITKNPAKEENIIEFKWMAPEEFMKLDDRSSLFLKTTKKTLMNFFHRIKKGKI